MKKIITLFFCITMILCGCSSNEKENNVDVTTVHKESSSKIENEYIGESCIYVNEFPESTETKMFGSIEDIDLDVRDIKSLIILRVTINDPSKLSEFTYLEHLEIQESTINDLSFLSNLEKLNNLRIADSNINDFENISSLPNKDKISAFTIAYCNVNDNKLSDISLLNDFPNITELTLSGNDISDLTSMSTLSKLEYLNLEDGNFNITTLKPLYGLEKLSYVMLPLNCKYTDEDIAHFGEPGGTGIIQFH